MRNMLSVMLAAAIAALPACAPAAPAAEDAPQAQDEALHEPAAAQEAEQTQEEAVEMRMSIDGVEVDVEWESNESAGALMEMAAQAPVTIQMSQYGGFEQVGPLGAQLPRNDVQTVTSAGDIVLYSANQIVVFYGSNSWSYTRLGRIVGKTAGELAELLGNGDVVITLEVGNGAR